MLAGLLRLAHRYPRRGLWLLSLAAVALVATAIVLTEWLHLNPCHLCIFQRLQQLFLAVCFALGGWFVWRPAGRLWVAAGGLMALSGMAGGRFQSWAAGVSRLVGGGLGAAPNLLEQLVERAGARRAPPVMANRFCASNDTVISALSRDHRGPAPAPGFASAELY